MSVSHGAANGFYFQDTMLLQSFWSCQREERGRASNIWSAHGDVVILTSLAGHTEGIKPRRRRGREGEPERKGWEWEVEEEEQREGEGASGVEEREVLKKRVREPRLHVVVEGMVWIWRGTSSQVRLSPDEGHVSGFFIHLFLWVRVSVLRELASAPPSVVFSTLSFCPVCWLHVFVGFWTWSWELYRVCVAD